jgi:hypothetical protein
MAGCEYFAKQLPLCAIATEQIVVAVSMQRIIAIVPQKYDLLA